MLLKLQENGLYLAFSLEVGQPPLLLHWDAVDKEPSLPEKPEFYRLQEIQIAGESAGWHVGITSAATLPGSRMVYTGHRDTRNDIGRRLEIDTVDEKTGLAATMIYQFYDGLPILRCWNALENRGSATLGLEAVSSLVNPHVAGFSDDASVLIPHNSWQQELQWKENSLSQLGSRYFVHNTASGKRIQVRSIGSWSSGEYAPMGCLRNRTKGTMTFWQIEHNGSWNWELLEHGCKYHLIVTGPNDTDHHWYKELAPGERFESVPAAMGMVIGGEDEAFSVLDQYRRRIRRTNRDNENLPIIFNDYMNCLWADPTTEKELPIIDAAAKLGCEYYCIDAGWYTDEADWFPTIGEWVPSKTRFPNGLKEVTDYIRSRGMVPGLWLEIEFVGSKCPLVQQVDESWFFHRHGKIADFRGRYQLDFRNPEVRAYTRGVVDRLIRDFGVGYFKVDYNCNCYAGTDWDSDSLGDGLLEHNRAYLQWLDDIFEAYPDLVLENCSSGGMRMDYAMLSRHSIASASDQEVYLKFPSIVANSPTGMTPEQTAVWSYPLAEADREQIIFNCVSSTLCRIHQSGNTATLPESHKDIIREQYAFYKAIRKDIPHALPFWPLGLAQDGDDWISLGMDFGNCRRIAVWRLGGEDTCRLSLPKLKGKDLDIKLAFPKADSLCHTQWDKDAGILTASLPQPNMARILEISER